MDVNVARTTTPGRDCLGFLHYDAYVGGRTFAPGDIRGDLAELARRSVCVPDAVAMATVVFCADGGHDRPWARLRRVPGP